MEGKAFGLRIFVIIYVTSVMKGMKERIIGRGIIK